MANLEFPFPYKGKNENWSASRQPPLTSPSLKNVRVYDILKNRARGGQRPGLAKWGAGTLVGGTNMPVVAMCVIAVVT